MISDASGYAYYAYFCRSSNRIFGHDEALTGMRAKDISFVTAIQLFKRLRIDNSILTIPPFKIAKHKLIYVNPLPLKIDIRLLTAAVSRIIVIHNFQVEDYNSNLQECLAGIFFARYINGHWEQPEDHPVECRTIATIGVLDKQAGIIYHP